MEKDIEKLKKEIISLIDESTLPVIKEAFYSNPDVEAVMEKLYEQWESNNHAGIPLDYATYEELLLLHKVAKKVVNSPHEELSRSRMRRAMGLPEKTEEKKSGWKRLFKKA
ncbi:hypothetical protein IMZ38_04260 [Thermosphaera chiliense]|uniref:Uncharacterized protein n=1 Tax=Thermosphaera chiliense TaxID=3402707 RepID=A0A7M1UNT8_9CREN|nr:hypothetical protein [Thermosphaera aggregans]QOR93871.1 hypothetical protein IMZ38_04260 [Thermosphaera aggregans]